MATRKPQDPIGFNHMVRDVLVAAINKGQLLPIIFGIILFAMILKIPGNDLAEIAREILKHLITLHLVGYALFFLILILWARSSRATRQDLLSFADKIPKGGGL